MDNNLAKEPPYEFEKDLLLEKPAIYALIDLINNPFRRKAFLTKDEFENKIPKGIQQYYQRK